MVAGRDLTWTDIEDKRPVVLLSENLARELWRDPVAAMGKRLREAPKSDSREVVGVVADERDDGLNQKPPEIAYYPYFMRQFWGGLNSPFVRRFLVFAVRSPRAGTAGFLKEIQKAVWSVNPDLPLGNVRTQEDIARKSGAHVIHAGEAGACGRDDHAAGVSWESTASSRIRCRSGRGRSASGWALGAREQTVTRMFLRHALLLTGTGVIFGLAAATALMRLMTSLLFEVSAVDPLTYGAVAAALTAAALAASYFPTRRVMAVDPVEALRTE
jgi:hypothetical protein